MAKAHISKQRKVHLSRLKAVRKRLVRKSKDPRDKDDPDWVKIWIKNVDIRISKKEKSLDHRQTQRKAGQKRIRKRHPDT